MTHSGEMTNNDQPNDFPLDEKSHPKRNRRRTLSLIENADSEKHLQKPTTDADLVDAIINHYDRLLGSFPDMYFRLRLYQVLNYNKTAVADLLKIDEKAIRHSIKKAIDSFRPKRNLSA